MKKKFIVSAFNNYKLLDGLVLVTLFPFITFYEVLNDHLSLADSSVYLGDISVRVSIDGPSTGAERREDECHHFDQLVFPRDATLHCMQKMEGRFVSIQRMGGYQVYRLTLCEIIVWGNKPSAGECSLILQL